jgi:DNA repair exonuclease SbcCD ATPase subunit
LIGADESNDAKQLPEDEPRLKRTRVQVLVVESEVDGVDSEQAMEESEVPVKKRRAPPFRTGARRGRGKGRGRGRGRVVSELPNLKDEPEIVRLRERQAELRKAFKAIVVPHATVLEEISRRDLEKLKKSSKAHKEVPEYEEVIAELQARLAQRKEEIFKEYEARLNYEDAMLEKRKEWAETCHKVSGIFDFLFDNLTP